MIFFQCPMLTTPLLNWPFSIRYSGWLKLSFVIFSTSSWGHIIPGLCRFEHIHLLILHLSGHKTLRSHSSPWRILGDPALLEFCCREVFWTVFPLYVLGIMLRCESPLGFVKMQILTPEAGAEVPHLYGAGLWKLSVKELIDCQNILQCQVPPDAQGGCPPTQSGPAQCPVQASPFGAVSSTPALGGTSPGPQTSCHRPSRIVTSSPSCGRGWKVLASFTRNWCHLYSDWYKQDLRGKGNGDTAWSSIIGGPKGGRQSKNMGFEVKAFPGMNPRLWSDRCVTPELAN